MGERGDHANSVDWYVGGVHSQYKSLASKPIQSTKRLWRLEVPPVCFWTWSVSSRSGIGFFDTLRYIVYILYHTGYHWTRFKPGLRLPSGHASAHE